MTSISALAKPRYYPIQAKWRRLRPLFEDSDVLELMHQEMEAYSSARSFDWGSPYKPRAFSPKLRPADYDYCDWRYMTGKRGRKPSFWNWACYSACHWVVSHNLVVISRLEPDHPWQIASSDKHSTVVDLERKLMFDTNFQAIGIKPDECWTLAVEDESTELLDPDDLMLHDIVLSE